MENGLTEHSKLSVRSDSPLAASNSHASGEESEHLHSMLRLARKLEHAHDYKAVIDAIHHEISLVLGYNTTWAYLNTDNPDIWHLLSAHESVGISDTIPTLTIKGDRFLEEVATSDYPVIVEDARTDPRTNKDIVAALGNRSVINMPMKFSDKRIGTIGTGTFGDEGVKLLNTPQLEYLESMSSHAAVAIDRVRQYQERIQAEKEKRLAQEKIAHVQRLESLGVMAGSIAHDFHNMLSAILGNAELAESEVETGSPAVEYLHNISNVSHRAADMCHQLLAYAGRHPIDQTSINISALVHETLSFLQVSIGKNIVIDKQLIDPLPAFLGDATQIQQIILNLITNANEAIGELSGKISVSTGLKQIDRTSLEQLTIADYASHGEHIFFEISDTGCGMGETTLKSLFDPFYTTKLTGRGLGMSAVLGILKTHQGALDVKSIKGQGTTFKVFFPVATGIAE